MAGGDIDIRVVDISTRASYITPEASSDIAGTEFGGGRGGSGTGPMDPISAKDYIDVRCGEIRAENRADLAEIKSLIETKMDKLPSLWQLVSTVAAASVATIGLILAVLSYTGDRVDASASLGASLQRVETRADDNAKALEDLRNDRTKPVTRPSPAGK